MLQTKSTHNLKQGFSLVELLVVMAIIAILMGLVIGVSGAIQRKAAIARARAEISNLMMEIEQYKADEGRYPASYNAGSGTISGDPPVMVMKSTDPANPGFMDWYEDKYPNTRFDIIEISSNNDNEHTWFTDPWGQAIVYDEVRDFTYRIGSRGPNGSFGESGNNINNFGEFDDITNRNGAL